MTPDPRGTFYTEETRLLGRKQDADRTPFLTDLDRRMRVFDDMGVDAQVISPAPDQCYYSVPPEVAVKAARVLNEGIAEIARSRPDRIPAAMGIGAAAGRGRGGGGQLEYCMTTLGLKGVEIIAHVARQGTLGPNVRAFLGQGRSAGCRDVHSPEFVSAAAAVQ